MTQPPEPAHPITPLDWRLIGALRGDALRSLTDVGEEVGVSYRTARRRVDRLMRGGCATIIPVVELTRVEGLLVFDLFLALDGDSRPPSETFREVRHTVGDRELNSLQGRHEGTAHADIVVFARSLAEVEATRREAADVPGVKRAVAIFNRGTHESAWYTEQVAQRVRAATLSDSPGRQPQM